MGLDQTYGLKPIAARSCDLYHFLIMCCTNHAYKGDFAVEADTVVLRLVWLPFQGFIDNLYKRYFSVKHAAPAVFLIL